MGPVSQQLVERQAAVQMQPDGGVAAGEVVERDYRVLLPGRAQGEDLRIADFQDLLAGRPIRTVKCSASGSPATGSAKAHALEQQTLLNLAFEIGR